MGPLGGDVVAELPFVLMHPKPEDDPEPSGATPTDGDPNHVNSEGAKQESNDFNLIQLDTYVYPSSPYTLFCFHNVTFYQPFTQSLTDSLSLFFLLLLLFISMSLYLI